MSGNSLYEIAYEDAIDLYWKAECSFKDGRIQQASQYLHRALEITPPYPKIYFLKIECDLLMKNTSEASIVCGHALEILENPKYQLTDSIHDKLDLLYAKFKICCEMQELEQALTASEKVEEILKKMLDERIISLESFNQTISKVRDEVSELQRKISDRAVMIPPLLFVNLPYRF